MTDHTTAVDRPEVDDPRVLALAVARQQMAYESPFNFVCPPWDGLSEQEQHLSLLDARNYLRAALKAGLVPAVVPSVGVPALRDRVRRAVCEAEGFAWDSSMLEPDEYGDVADAVLAALPAPADRAAEGLAKHVVRAIFALKSPTPPGSEHYRAGWDDGVEAAMDAARDAVLHRLATEAAAPVVGVAADTTPAAERPRCTYCGLPHDLTPSMALACASIRAMVDTVAPAEPGPVVPAQPGNDTPVVAYRSHSGSLLRCLTHTPDQTALDNGTFHPVTADDLPDGGICTYRAPGVECGVDVLTPQQPKEA